MHTSASDRVRICRVGRVPAGARTGREPNSQTCTGAFATTAGLKSAEDGDRRGPATRLAKSAASAAAETDDRPERLSEALTMRQHEVLALLAAGYPMKAVARRLGITYRTVTFHKYRTMQRLGISTNAGLIAYALTRSNIAPDATTSA